MNEITVWRLHLNNDIDTNKGLQRKDLLPFCQKEKIIGVGWNDIKTHSEDREDIHREASNNNYTGAGVKAVSAMSQMKINDLVWTRMDSIYYLCRVTSLWRERQPDQRHTDLDIGNYVGVQWLEIGRDDHVPGKVVSSFRPAASVQRVNDVTEISKYLWNKFANQPDYKLDKTKTSDYWTLLSAESIEELVLLYLQVKHGYHIYSTTAKNATDTFECTMVNSEGRHGYPQVKSGSVGLNGEEYLDFLDKNIDADVYLFAVSQYYGKASHPRLHYIIKDELETFVRDYWKLLPVLTQGWISIATQDLLEE